MKYIGDAMKLLPINLRHLVLNLNQNRLGIKVENMI